MADSTITPNAPVMAGTTYTWVSPVISTNYLFTNTGTAVLCVENAHATDPVTVTISRYATFDGEAVADRTVVINAGVKKMIGLFPTSIYSIKSGADVGKGKFTFSMVSSVSFLLLQM